VDISIGLPSTIPGCEPSTLLEWATTADRVGFTSLSVADRLVYANLDPLVTLAAVASVTSQVNLLTAVLLAPLRSGHVDLAKRVVSIDRIAGGRLLLGLAVGSRRDDYEAAGVEFTRRGRILDRQLETMTELWRSAGAGLGLASTTAGGPRLAFGGQSPATFARVARYGVGWIAGSGSGPALSAAIDQARTAWSAAGRPGRPRIWALSYFGLGPGGADGARSFLGDYYSYRGPLVEQIIGACLLDGRAVTERVEALAVAGCDEVIFNPVLPSVDQVARLADIVGLGGA